MELRIDPNFPATFDRLRKAFRKKSAHVRDMLDHAARNGRGLAQSDKLALAWRQHKRAVFWVRVDRALRLMYEQDGDLQTVLYVGKHQEAEAVLRNLPKKCAAEETIPVSDWLERTAPAIALRIDKPEPDRKPVANPSAQRRLIQALENLVEDCLLNVGPAVIEDCAAPREAELERHLTELRDEATRAAETERDSRERLEGRLAEIATLVTSCESEIHTLRAELKTAAERTVAMEGELTTALAHGSEVANELAELRRDTNANAEDARRSLSGEFAAGKEVLCAEIGVQAERLVALDERLCDARRAADAARRDFHLRLDEAIDDCRRQIAAETERRRSDREDHARNVTAFLEAQGQADARQTLQATEQARQHRELAQRVEALERELAAAAARPGWWESILPKWIWR